jgi:PAS domain S-box-containing protein
MINDMNRYSIYFQANPEMMLLMNLNDGAYMDANPAFLNTLQIDRAEIVGKSALELGFLTSKDREVLENSIKSRRPLKDYEIVLQSKSGAVVVGSLSCMTIRIESKPYLVTKVTDITQRKYQQVANQKIKEMETYGLNRNLVNN